MNHDTKVGLGLGILLVGIVSAFYFREQPHAQDSLPEIQSVEALDRQISESLSVVDQQSTSLEKFEQRFRSDLKLEKIDVDRELPAVIEQPVKIIPDLAPQQAATDASSDDENSVAAFDPEFEFLNDPAVADTVDAPSESNGQLARSEPSTEENQTEQSHTEANQPSDLPAKVVGQPESMPPRELPLAVEMFSEDLDSPQVPEVQIPLRLDPITIDASDLLPPEAQTDPEHSDERPKSESPQNQQPDHQPVRDPRIIVPKRVRLNEPIARRTIEQMQGPEKTEKTTNPAKTPSADRSENSSVTPERPASEELPTLEGLKPLDPSR